MLRVALLARRTPSSSTPETRRRADLAAAAERSAVIRAVIRSDPCHQSEEAHHARAGTEQQFCEEPVFFRFSKQPFVVSVREPLGRGAWGVGCYAHEERIKAEPTDQIGYIQFKSYRVRRCPEIVLLCAGTRMVGFLALMTRIRSDNCTDHSGSLGSSAPGASTVGALALYWTTASRQCCGSRCSRVARRPHQHRRRGAAPTSPPPPSDPL